MAKKNNKLPGSVWKEIADQEWRIKQIISKFYPDGVRTEFMKATHIGKIYDGFHSDTALLGRQTGTIRMF